MKEHEDSIIPWKACSQSETGVIRTERDERKIFFESRFHFRVRQPWFSLSVVFILKHLSIYISRRPKMFFVQIDLFVWPGFN